MAEYFCACDFRPALKHRLDLAMQPREHLSRALEYEADIQGYMVI